jgi:hypothetical protein
MNRQVVTIGAAACRPATSCMVFWSYRAKEQHGRPATWQSARRDAKHEKRSCAFADPFHVGRGLRDNQSNTPGAQTVRRASPGW